VPSARLTCAAPTAEGFVVVGAQHAVHIVRDELSLAQSNTDAETKKGIKK
jgi:hypothetical protein